MQGNTGLTGRCYLSTKFTNFDARNSDHPEMLMKYTRTSVSPLGIEISKFLEEDLDYNILEGSTEPSKSEKLPRLPHGRDLAILSYASKLAGKYFLRFDSLNKSRLWSGRGSEIGKHENPRGSRVLTSTVGKINPAAKRHYEVPGNLNGAQVTAFPDTGAEGNVISLDFAVRNKLDIQRHSQLEFQLPTGRVSRSVGTAYLPWRFADEPKVFNILFSVLPKCTHDVIIGGKFLKFTQTLTKFARRIKTKLLPFPPRLGVKLLGSQRQRVWGSLDGECAVAVPDTGSDVMLVSTAYAMQRGFKISGQKDCRSELEFANGSRAFTRGLVKDVDWSFNDSDTSYQCDFHVLDNLSVDVVLSNDFLFDVNAFSEYDSSFFDEDDVSAEGYVELSLVRQISWLSNRIQKAFGRKTQEGKCKISRCLTLDILLMYGFL